VMWRLLLAVVAVDDLVQGSPAFDRSFLFVTAISRYSVQY